VYSKGRHPKRGAGKEFFIDGTGWIAHIRNQHALSRQSIEKPLMKYGKNVAKLTNITL